MLISKNGVMVSSLLLALIALGMACAPIAAPTTKPAAKLQQVTFRLDWIFQGPNAGFMVAKDKGFYEQVGLDVTIGPGKGSGSTAQLIGSKSDMIGFADGYVVGNSVDKGMDIKMVASIYRRNPTGVVVLAESDIKAPKDLEGKTIGIPTGSTQYQQWPAFVKGCNLDGGKIPIANIEPAALSTALLTGKVDAVAGYVQGVAPGTEILGGKQTRALWYTDCGVTAVSNGIIVHTDLLKEDPDLIRRFVEASLRGFLWTRANPDEAVAIVKKFSETVDPRIAKRELELSWQAWVTPNTKDQPLGWMAEKDWEETVRVLMEYGGVTTPLDPRQLYTNEFIPMSSEFIPPQT